MGGPDYELPGTVTRIDLQQNKFEVFTVINDGNPEFPMDWYPLEPSNDWKALPTMDERARLHFIFGHLKEHTRRLNPSPNGIEPQTSWIETSKGRLAFQFYRDNQGGTRPRLVKLNQKTTGRISGKGLQDMIDRIADPACAEPFPIPKRRPRPKRRTGGSVNSESEHESDLEFPYDPDFIPSKRRLVTPARPSRRSEPGDASTSAARTGGTRAGRVQDDATGSLGASPSGPANAGPSMAMVSFGAGNTRDGDDGSSQPEPDLSLDAPDRDLAVDESSIQEQENQVRVLEAQLEEHKRAIGSQVQSVRHELESLMYRSLNPVDLSEGSGLQCAGQLLDANQQFRSRTDALYHALAEKRQQILECEDELQQATALLGHMRNLLHCRGQRQAAERLWRAADEEMRRAFLTRNEAARGFLTSASQRLEAARIELDRLKEVERAARVAYLENVGPRSD
jgi:hypothetical protein